MAAVARRVAGVGEATCSPRSDRRPGASAGGADRPAVPGRGRVGSGSGAGPADLHPLLGRPVGRAAGCSRPRRACRARTAVVPGPAARRVWAGRRSPPCQLARRGRRSGHAVRASCAVAACTRRPRRRASPTANRTRAGGATRRVATPRWTRSAGGADQPPVVVAGQVSLRGLPPLVSAQVLFGLQQRCRSRSADPRCGAAIVLRGPAPPAGDHVRDCRPAADRGWEVKGTV